eukprot:gene5276-biopygen5263
MVHLVPMNFGDSSAQTVARIYFDVVWRQHGAPMKIVCGRDPRFQDSFWRELMRLMGMAVKFSSQLRDARSRLELAQQRQREQFDRRHKQQRRRQLAEADRGAPVAYRLALPPHWRIHDVFAKYRLKPYVSGTDEFASRARPPIPDPVMVDGQAEVHVNEILEYRVSMVKGKLVEEWKVRWTGYSATHDQWRTRDKMEPTTKAERINSSRSVRHDDWRMQYPCDVSDVEPNPENFCLPWERVETLENAKSW